MKTDELMKKLESDSEYQAMMRRKDKEREELSKLLIEDEKELIRDLRRVGFKVESVWDFVNNNVRYSFLRKFSGSYNKAYPILVQHLNIEHYPRTREGIIRALTEKDANESASEALLDAFYKEQDKNLKWVLSNALRTVLTRSQKAKHPSYKEVYKNGA